MHYIIKDTESKLATIRVTLNAGSRVEYGKWSPGIAHFLEHMMFKGTTKRTYLDISKEISFLGGNTNAGTSTDFVNYYITVPYDNLSRAVEILSDMIFNSTIPEVEFNKEKQVVLEEEASSNDNLSSWIYRNLLSEFTTGPLSNPIIGTKESITGITRDEMLRFYKEFYTRDNMIVTLSVDVDRLQELGTDATELLRNYFGDEDGVTQENFLTVDPEYGDSRELELTRSNIEQTYLHLVMPGITKDSRDEPVLDIMLDILGGGMDSRLFENVREKHGLCYGIGASSFSSVDYGAVIIYSSTRKENKEELIKLILAEVERMKNEPVSNDELQSVKNKHRASMYKIEESAAAYANEFTSRYMFNSMSITEYDNAIKAITVDDVMEAANKYLDTTKMLTVVCSAPEEK